MSDRKILFVVEGKRADPRFLRKLVRTFFDVRPENVFSYGTNIHALLESVYDGGGFDEYIDLARLLMERADEDDRRLLSQRFTDVFLIFDLDPQDPRYDPDRLEAALEFFDDSTDMGKLYINYPMLESYRHMRAVGDKGFLDSTVEMAEVCNYKRIVGDEGCAELRDVSKITEAMLRTIVLMNVWKAGTLIGCGTLPSVEEYLEWKGADIFRVQEDLMDRESKLYVLNTSLFNPVDFKPSAFLGSTSESGSITIDGPVYEIQL